MSYLPTYTVNVGNWSSRHRGKIVGFLQAPYQIGPVFMSILYYSFFAEDQEVNIDEGNIGGFFACVSGILGTFTLLAAILTREYKYIETDEDKEHSFLIKNNSEEMKLADQSNEPIKHTSFWYGMKHLDVELIFWAQAMTPAAGMSMLTTMTPMLNSFGYFNLSFTYTTCIPFVILVLKFIITYFSDKYIHKLPRIFSVLILSTCSSIILLFCIFYGDHLAVISIAFLVTISTGEITFSLLPTAFTEKFHISIFGLMFTLGCFVASITSALVQPLAGLLYDIQTIDGECHGLHCFQMVYVFQFCLQAIATTLLIFSLLSSRQIK